MQKEQAHYIHIDFYVKTKAAAQTAIVLSIVSIISLQGCALPRNPVPIARISDGTVVNFSDVRSWEVEYAPDVTFNPTDSSDCSFLVLSGGGSKGAFAAGFLNGWTVAGTRPQFKIVTGISTGALIAPLAFLGSDYDEQLKTSYTTLSTKDILRPKGLMKFSILAILTGESTASTKPLEDLIKEMITPDVMQSIAKEHTKGRRLYIGTTNLDAQRLVAWDMGLIACSPRPDAIDLFRKVMLASASIPGAFPPVYFDVEIEGRQYDEMHVDGGVIAGLFGYGTTLFSQPQPQGLCSIYILKNGKLDLESQQVRRRFFPIVGRSLATLMKSQSWNDIFRLHNEAQRDGVSFHYVSIPYDFISEGEEMFDVEEMKRMYDLGYKIAVSENPWQTEIPTFRKDHKWLWTPEDQTLKQDKEKTKDMPIEP